MKKRYIVLLALCAAGVLGLCILKFAEDIVAFKNRFYPPIVDFVRELLTDEFDPSQYEPIVLAEGAWYQDAPLIYHAGGGIDGLDYTNSKEALEQTLAQGGRFVEMDFLYTADGALVCAHEWEDFSDADTPHIPTAEEFLSQRIYGKYTPMTAAALVGYMAAYDDLYIVVDTKEPDPVPVISELVRLSRDVGATDRLILQLYNDRDKEEILALYPFHDENFLLTLYKFGTDRLQETMALCYDEQISVITLPHGAWDQETIDLFRSKGFVLYEHTVNRPDEAATSLREGICGFYTDFLQPEDLTVPAAPIQPLSRR